MTATRVALLSNPTSTGNRSLLPRIRDWCATHPDVFHYEVDDVDQIGEALSSIAYVRPRVLIINGGDGTVQATLTELHHGAQFGDAPPPVAVLPNGKTNLIALDLGAAGDPIAALERIVAIAGAEMDDHVVRRELIALTEGENRAVLGMFMGGAGLAEAILYCRNKVYPLGLPNAVSHTIAFIAVMVSLLFGIRAAFLPGMPQPVRVSVLGDGKTDRRFSIMIVTTLEKMLLGSRTDSAAHGLRFMAVDRSLWALLRAMLASAGGRLGTHGMRGVHVEHGNMIRIESERGRVILDGETFCASRGRPITLRSTAPMPFLRLAA